MFQKNDQINPFKLLCNVFEIHITFIKYYHSYFLFETLYVIFIHQIFTFNHRKYLKYIVHTLHQIKCMEHVHIHLSMYVLCYYG